MKIKIMSYNTQHCLNFITREIDFDMIVNTIKECDADIVGLQEIRDKGEAEGYEAQAKIIADKLGYHYYFAKAIYVKGKNPYGNAIVSRYPIISAQTLSIPDPEQRNYNNHYESRCILKATIDIDGGLEIIVSHFGLNPDEHINAVETVLSNIDDKRCVLMGDFNMTPDNPTLEPIKNRLYDTAKKFSSPKLSFPSDKPRIKIDYIFVTEDIKVHSADIPEIISSDHRPYVAIIE